MVTVDELRGTIRTLAMSKDSLSGGALRIRRPVDRDFDAQESSSVGAIQRVGLEMCTLGRRWPANELERLRSNDTKIVIKRKPLRSLSM